MSTESTIGNVEHDWNRTDSARWYEAKAQKCNL